MREEPYEMFGAGQTRHLKALVGIDRRDGAIARFNLHVIFALLFFTTGAAKLSGADLAVLQYDLVGLGQSFRYVSGLVDVIGAFCFLVPRTTTFGALLVLSIMLATIGATPAQVTRAATNPIQVIMPCLSAERIYEI